MDPTRDPAPTDGAPVRVGLVSDTHGLLHPRLPSLFEGCRLILHAGDIDRLGVLRALGALAPVRAVRGNNDHGPGLAELPALAQVPLGHGHQALVVHILGAGGRPSPEVRRAAARSRPSLLLFGHSHQPSARVEDGRLLVNPGSAGPRRFRLPRAAGVLTVEPGRLTARVVDLDDAHLRPLWPELILETA